MEETKPLTLGQLIDLIEKIGVNQKDGEFKVACFDFGTLQPTNLRINTEGKLSLGYKLTLNDTKEEYSDTKLEELLIELNSYKEDYLESEIWCSNKFNSSNTAITGVIDEEWRVVLLTTYINK